MILILCNDFQDASDAFIMFRDFCNRYEPFMILEADQYSLRCTTDDDLTYIFMDERYGKVIDQSGCDVVGSDLFFEDLFGRYDNAILEDFFYGAIPW